MLYLLLSCTSHVFPQSEDDRSGRNGRTKYFRSVTMVPEDQLTRVRENHTIWRSQPQSFASENDPTLIIWPTTQKQGRQRGISSAFLSMGYTLFGDALWLVLLPGALHVLWYLSYPPSPVQLPGLPRIGRVQHHCLPA